MATESITEEDISSPQPPDSAPHLVQRMVHPALLQGAKMMNLGSAAQRFGSENLVLSPQNQERRSSLENTPGGWSEGQRAPFSLAEAMQAARRLNMEQPSVSSKTEDTTAVMSTDLERDFSGLWKLGSRTLLPSSVLESLLISIFFALSELSSTG